MNYKPLQDRIILKRITDEKIASGLLYRVDTAEDQYVKGKVLEVGPGLFMDGEIRPVRVNKDDIVLYDKSGATKLDDVEGKLDMVREFDVQCVVVE